MITREALRVLKNQLSFTMGVNRKYDSKFGIEGAKIGTTLNVRKPPRYVGGTGASITVEDATETSVPVVLTTQANVAISFSSIDLALSIDDFSKRFIVPAVANIANRVDNDGLALYKQVYNSVGTPGTVPSTLLTYLNANRKLDENAAPMDGTRRAILNPEMQVSIVDALKGLFQSSTQIAKQYEKGQMGIAAGLNFHMDQNVNVHTMGAQGGTPLVNGASQTGASLVTDGWTAAAAARLRLGDTFTIAGVYAVNPQSKATLNSLQQFVVTANVSSDGAGNATIPISPAIVSAATGFQNVSNSPADNAAITVIGAASVLSPQGLVHHPDAFTMVCADLPLFEGSVKGSRVSDEDLGLSVRMMQQYAIGTDQYITRLDFLYGWAVLYPELACRIQS